MKLKIKSKNIKNRFVYINLQENKKATEVAIFLSGFSGSSEYPLFKSAAKVFQDKGYSVIRFNFCIDREETKRKSGIKMEEIRLSFYAEELKNVIDSLGEQYTRIILVGHSFGAIASILFLSRFKKYKRRIELILWEPSLLPWKRGWMEEDFSFDAKTNLYREKYSNELFNRKFYNECINVKDTTETFMSLNKSTCIIAVKNCGDKNAKKYFSKIQNKKASKLIIMSGTGHSFEGKRHKKKLLDETLSFLKSTK